MWVAIIIRDSPVPGLGKKTNPNVTLHSPLTGGQACLPVGRIWVSVFVFLLLSPVHSLQAAVYRVGPSHTYATLQQVAGLLSPGDSVLVDGDATYPGGVIFTRPGSAAEPIVVHGVRINGHRPVIEGGTNGVEFRTSGTAADHYVFEGFEVRNASFRGIYHHADDLTLRDLVVHHCNNGLMGADNDSGTLLLEYCEFYANGSGDRAHQIYMATDEAAHPGSVFRMQFCYMHDGAGGNNVKSRSERNEIYYNWIEGGFYHELELIGPDPSGGVPANAKREDSDVVGNILRKRATAYSGGTFSVTRFGGDGTGESKGRYRVVNNTIIMGTGSAFRLFDSLESVEMHNNVFVSHTGAAAPIIRTVEAFWTSGEKISGQNNWVQNVLTTIPAGWTGTIGGDDPGFRDAAGGDFSPASGSPLIDAGTSGGQAPPGFPFTEPLFPPVFEPPVETLPDRGGAAPRQITGAIDIGAFEYRQATHVAMAGGPEAFALFQNFPNPFNPKTVVSSWLLVASEVRLGVYDMLGRQVAVLVNERREAGRYRDTFDGSGLASGMYIYRLRVGAFDESRTMLLLR